MNKKIIKIAERKAKNLIKKYEGFNNIILDNWRGYRFIYDTENYLILKSNGKKQRLSYILKNETGSIFNGGLLLASSSDKKIFGRMKYLNCKKLWQYKRCYINFINQINNKKELKNELYLVNNLRIIYSKKKNKNKIEREFKSSIINSKIVKKKKELLEFYVK